MWNQTNTARTADELVRPLVRTAVHNSIPRLGHSETPAVVINGLNVETAISSSESQQKLHISIARLGQSIWRSSAFSLYEIRISKFRFY